VLRMSVEGSVLRALDTLRALYGLECDASVRELIEYLTGLRYEEDTTTLDDVFRSWLLTLHEVAEICILKSWGFDIGQDTVVKAYPHTYRAHLAAMEIELREALRIGAPKHLESRCRDLETYLSDPYLPRGLEKEVTKLINELCNTVKKR